MTPSLREQSRHCPPEAPQDWQRFVLGCLQKQCQMARRKAVPAGVQELLCSGFGQRRHGAGLQHEAARLSEPSEPSEPVITRADDSSPHSPLAKVQRQEEGLAGRH